MTALHADALFELAHERGERLRAEANAERLVRAVRNEKKKEVVIMSTQEQGTDKKLEEWARERVALRRSLEARVVTFGLGMLVLTPVWIVGEYLNSGGWPQRLSGNDNPGDWSPWIIWVALVWGFYVVLTAVSIHFRRPTSEREVEREIARLVRHG